MQDGMLNVVLGSKSKLVLAENITSISKASELKANNRLDQAGERAQQRDGAIVVKLVFIRVLEDGNDFCHLKFVWKISSF